MIKQEAADTIPWDAPTLIYGKVASEPLQAADGNAFVLMPGVSSADSVMPEDRYKGLASIGATVLVVIFVLLLVLPSFFRKGR